MIDPVKKGTKEIWEWKRRDEEATRGMTRAEVIEYYRRGADEVERRWGLHLKKRRGDDGAAACKRE